MPRKISESRIAELEKRIEALEAAQKKPAAKKKAAPKEEADED